MDASRIKYEQMLSGIENETVLYLNDLQLQRAEFELQEEQNAQIRSKYHALLRVAMYYGSKGRISDECIASLQIDEAHVMATLATFADHPEFEAAAKELGNVFSEEENFFMVEADKFTCGESIYTLSELGHMNFLLRETLGTRAAAKLAAIFGYATRPDNY